MNKTAANPIPLSAQAMTLLKIKQMRIKPDKRMLFQGV